MDFGDETNINIANGDVKIILGASRVYQVQSEVLIRATQIGREQREQDGLGPGFFANLLQWPRAALSQAAVRRGVTTRYHIVATAVSRDEDGKFHLILKPVPLNEEGQPTILVRPCLGYETGMPVPAVFDAFTAILGALYGKSIRLDASDNPEDRIEYTMHIVDLAEMLGVKYAIVKPLEACLKQPTNGQLFHKIIAADPAPWLQFSYRIRSIMIFKEALIHAAGQAHSSAMGVALFDGDMRPEISHIVQFKCKELKQTVKKVIQDVLSYYPPSIQREIVGNDTSNIGRSSYSNDIYHWVALTLFRQYISQEAITHLGGEDLGHKLALQISKAGNNYLTPDDYANFYAFCPMTTKAKTTVDTWLNQLKNDVKNYVAPLLVNRSSLNTEVSPTPYFTCTVVNMDDYPFDMVGY